MHGPHRIPSKGISTPQGFAIDFLFIKIGDLSQTNMSFVQIDFFDNIHALDENAENVEGCANYRQVASSSCKHNVSGKSVFLCHGSSVR